PHGVPRALADVVHRCLSKAPDDRFQTAAELESALALLGRLEPEPLASSLPAPETSSRALEDARERERMEAAAESAAREIPPDLQFESLPAPLAPEAPPAPAPVRAAAPAARP